VAVPTVLRLNSVPNTHTSQHYVIVRSVPLPNQVAPLRVLPVHPHGPSDASDLNHPCFPFSRLQTKKLRRIDCNNRYCVWSIAHPQPVNLCQPCYCDKVRYASISSRSAQTSLSLFFFFQFQFNPTPFHPRTDAISILLCPVPRFFLSSLPFPSLLLPFDFCQSTHLYIPL
jgi:hypothetical protein